MPLTPDKLEDIDWHLRYVYGLSNDELIAELTDHFSFAVDERIAAGQTITAAMEAAVDAFGGGRGLANFYATIGFTVGFLSLLCVGELLRRQHPILKRFV